MDHDREREHCEAIDKEKKTYADCFQQLRDLKASIEHIQRLIEKGGNKLQSDFEKWYNHQNDIGGRNTTNELSPPLPKTSVCEINVKMNENAEAKEESDNLVQKNESTQNEKQFTLPPGIRLTGNKEADDDIIAFYKAKEELLARRNKST